MDDTRMKEIAELETRRYFDHYQTEVFPGQLKSIIEAHDADDKAHGAVEKRMDKAQWLFYGVCIVCGGLGAFVRDVLANFGS